MSITGDTVVLLSTHRSLASGGHFPVIFLFQLDTTHHVNAFPVSEASFRVRDMLQWLVCSVGAAEYIESLFVLLSRTAAERRYLLTERRRYSDIKAR